MEIKSLEVTAAPLARHSGMYLAGMTTLFM
jgi:hypothetical protein